MDVVGLKCEMIESRKKGVDLKGCVLRSLLFRIHNVYIMRNNNAVYTFLSFLSSHMVSRKLRTFRRGDFFSPSTGHLLIVSTLCIAVAYRVFPRKSGPVSTSPTACAALLTHSLPLNHLLVPVPEVPAEPGSALWRWSCVVACSIKKRSYCC